MRTIDFSPFMRSSVGFDRLMDLLEDTLRFPQDDGYPPYNIEKTGEDRYRIEMAVAGFGEDDLSILVQENQLVVSGRKADEDGVQYLHRGIAGRAFERRFNLADHIQVTGASLVNGLLRIDLVREVPEELKPRRIAIASGPSAQPKQIEGKKAA